MFLSAYTGSRQQPCCIKSDKKCKLKYNYKITYMVPVVPFSFYIEQSQNFDKCESSWRIDPDTCIPSHEHQ